jgi:hypothetical protein
MSRHAPAGFLSVLALLLPPAGVGAQEITVGPGRAVVATAGHGEIMLRPDRATVSVTVRTIAPEPDQASSRNLEVAEAVTGALEALELELDSLRLTGVQMGPNREYTPDGPRDAGYFAARSLRVTTNDLADVGRIIQAAVGAGATQIDHIAYSSSGEEAARRQALALAVQKARGDAEVVASAAGGRLGPVILLSTQDVSIPRPVVGMEALVVNRAGADQAMPEPEDLTVTAFIQAHWAFIEGQ